MKRLIFIVVFICFAFTNVYAEGDFSTAIETVYNDSKEVVKSVYGDGKDLLVAAYPEVKAAVVSIAQSIGVAAEHVYTILVKKYIVDGVAELLLAILALSLFIWGCVKFDKTYKNAKYFTIQMILPCILFIISACLFITIDWQTMLMGIINPEWGAINYILDYAKTQL